MKEVIPLSPSEILNIAVRQRTEGSYEFNAILRDSGVSRHSLDHIMRGPMAYQVLKDLSRDNRIDTKYLTSAILSAMGYEEIPDEVKENLGITFRDTDDRVGLGHPDFAGVCGLAEGFMLDSLEEGSAFLVNDWMLLKQNERQLALCLETTATRSGTFVRGGWYAPNGEQAGIDAYLPLYGHKVELPWTYFRDVYHELPNSYDDFMSRVDGYVKGLRIGQSDILISP